MVQRLLVLSISYYVRQIFSVLYKDLFVLPSRIKRHDYDINILTNFQYSTVLLSCKYNILYIYIVLYIQPLSITNRYK